MTRWAFVADLNRCVGCQTCTAACKHANATGPWVQWRKVLDFECGEYPDVSRAFVPVGCMHCDHPSCMEVCPTTATRKREDGIVTIDYDTCIGCTYCIQACPYQARFKVDKPNEAYGAGTQMGHELKRESFARRGVAQKCTLCADTIDRGIAQGLTPGVDAAATPACVSSCISGALQMGDLDDPESNVSQLLATKQHFRMHEELGNGPNMYYLYDKNMNDTSVSEAPPMVEDPVGMATLLPQLQTHWDWRAAGNFAFGGAGSGLMIAAIVGGYFMPVLWLAVFLALALVGTGLFFVWLEIGRPFRFLNVFRNPKTSWMSREALAVLPYFAFGGLAWLIESRALGLIAAACALFFLYAQANVLRTSKAIPAWRQPSIVPLILTTGLVEGAGLLVLLAFASGEPVISEVGLVLAGLIAVRFAAWKKYRAELGRVGAPTKTFEVLNATSVMSITLQSVLLLLSIYGALGLGGHTLALAIAGLGAIFSGWMFKFILVTKAAYNQGYSINKMPARGAGSSSTGVQPGWQKEQAN